MGCSQLIRKHPLARSVSSVYRASSLCSQLDLMHWNPKPMHVLSNFMAYVQNPRSQGAQACCPTCFWLTTLWDRTEFNSIPPGKTEVITLVGARWEPTWLPFMMQLKPDSKSVETLEFSLSWSCQLWRLQEPLPTFPWPESIWHPAMKAQCNGSVG